MKLKRGDYVSGIPSVMMCGGYVVGFPKCQNSRIGEWIGLSNRPNGKIFGVYPRWKLRKVF